MLTNKKQKLKYLIKTSVSELRKRNRILAGINSGLTTQKSYSNLLPLLIICNKENFAWKQFANNQICAALKWPWQSTHSRLIFTQHQKLFLTG